MRFPTLRQLGLHVLSSVSFAVCSLAASAQSQPQIIKPVDAAVRYTLTNTIPVQVREASDLGRIPAGQPMQDMLMIVRGSDAQAGNLVKFLEDTHNPNSANYHHWLTPVEFGTQFGTSDADIKTVKAWLTSNGFNITAVAQGKNWIRFSGNAGQVENAFGTEMHRYSANGVTHYANATELSLPEALAPAVVGLVSLNDFVKSGQHTPLTGVARGTNGKLQRVAGKASASTTLNPAFNAQPNFTSITAPEETYLAPGDFARIYNTSPLIGAGTDGTGVSIAIVGRSDISLSDVEAFRTVFHLPFNDPTVIYANGDPGVVSGDDEEAILDVEWSGAVAPKAKINYVIGASTYTTDGIDIASAYIVDNAIAPIMSLSFGACEQKMSSTALAFYNTLWQQAAAEGITVFVSAGDAGSSTCTVPSQSFATTSGLGVNGLASTPYNVAVGGTEFVEADLNTYWNTALNADLSSVKGYVPEAVWNESCNTFLPVGIGNCYYAPSLGGAYAGGGGASNCAVHSATANALSGLYTCTSGYTKPSWQAGKGVPADNVRDLPDVSLAAAGAHDGYLICYGGSCQWTTNLDGSINLNSATIIGGTSASSPSMAGIMALIEQKNGSYQGQANYQFYKLAAQQPASLNCDSSAATDPTNSNACVFHDVTAGTNALSCVLVNGKNCSPVSGIATYGLSTGYSAGAGFDPASGLGSVNAANLVAAWGTAATAPSKTTLTVSQTTFTHGTAVTVGAAVAPGSGTGVPTGALVLKASGTGVINGPLQAGTLTAGAYSASINNLPGGSYSLTADYGGDSSYSSSVSAPVALTVAPEASKITVTSLAPSPFAILGKHALVKSSSTTLNTNFFLQAVVTGASGAGLGTGTVSLSDGTKTFGTYKLDGTGTIYIACGPYTECDYAPGTYTFVATYSGDSSFNTNVTSFPPFTIKKGSTNWGVAVSTQTPPAGAQVIATVEFQYDPAILPTGPVILNRQDTGAVLGTATIDATGVATIPFIAPAGSYNVTASYAGDANYTAGILISYPEIITTGTGTTASATTMTGAATTAVLGQRIALTIKVKPATAGTAVPTGTITLFSAAGALTNPVNLVNGSINTFFELDAAGTQSFFAVYSGDGTYTGSSSATSTIAVSKATPIVNLNAQNAYVAIGAQTSVTTAVIPTTKSTGVPAPTGTVQFYDSVGGSAAQPMGAPQALNLGNGNVLIATLAPLLATGVNTVTAQYSGDTNWSAVKSSAVTINVTTPDFSAVATPTPLTLTAGQTGTLSIGVQSILGFTGAVSASCGGTLPAGISCTSTTLQPGGTGTITVASVAPGTTKAELKMPRGGFLSLPDAFGFAAFALFMLPRRLRRKVPVMVLSLLFIATSLAGCGGNSPQPTSIVLTSSNSKAASGTPVSLYATISSSNALKGSVSFNEGSTSLASAVPVSNGVAVLDTNTLSVGTHSITAVYSGDADNRQSTSSDVLAQTITGTFSLTVNVTSGNLSHPITLPVTLQ